MMKFIDEYLEFFVIWKVMKLLTTTMKKRVTRELADMFSADELIGIA